MARYNTTRKGKQSQEEATEKQGKAKHNGTAWHRKASKAKGKQNKTEKNNATKGKAGRVPQRRTNINCTVKCNHNAYLVL